MGTFEPHVVFVNISLVQTLTTKDYKGFPFYEFLFRKVHKYFWVTWGA